MSYQIQTIQMFKEKPRPPVVSLRDSDCGPTAFLGNRTADTLRIMGIELRPDRDLFSGKSFISRQNNNHARNDKIIIMRLWQQRSVTFTNPSDPSLAFKIVANTLYPRKQNIYHMPVYNYIPAYGIYFGMGKGNIYHIWVYISLLRFWPNILGI